MNFAKIIAFEKKLEKHTDWWMLINHANTGSRYYEFTINGHTYTVRLADHTDCYSNTDFNIAVSNSNLDGINFIAFNRILKKLKKISATLEEGVQNESHT